MYASRTHFLHAHWSIDRSIDQYSSRLENASCKLETVREYISIDFNPILPHRLVSFFLFRFFETSVCWYRLFALHNVHSMFTQTRTYTQKHRHFHQNINPYISAAISKAAGKLSQFNVLPLFVFSNSWMNDWMNVSKSWLFIFVKHIVSYNFIHTVHVRQFLYHTWCTTPFLCLSIDCKHATNILATFFVHF